ncbi:cytochrome cd1-nitrite reductase-like protein [Xylariales sp. AK1849]|nr:cytochrome cd1-nitrite reductase-like protein [Xylariales sp. AK1849]
MIYLDNNIAFAAMERNLGVLDTSKFKPVLKYTIPLPSTYVTGDNNPASDGYQFHGLTLTNDKKNLYVAIGYGAVIFDTAMAVAGRNDSVVGLLSQNGRAGNNSVEISITPDDKFVFLSQEFGNNATYNRGAIEVYKVTRHNNGTVTGEYKGFIVLGFATVSQQFSPDFKKLFVTSEVATDAASTSEGSISVLDVDKLKTTPGKAFLHKVNGGCHPVRCKITPDGKYLWVTVREANQLLAFDAEKLAKNQTSDVLVTTVQTGTSPVGIALIGSHVLTADSNRWGYSNTTTGITVVDSISALTDTVVNFPQIRTGQFPREFAVSPDGNTLLVGEYDALRVRAVDVSSFNNQ